jgi:hypothetical protein
MGDFPAYHAKNHWRVMVLTYLVLNRSMATCRDKMDMNELLMVLEGVYKSAIIVARLSIGISLANMKY